MIHTCSVPEDYLDLFSLIVEGLLHGGWVMWDVAALVQSWWLRSCPGVSAHEGGFSHPKVSQQNDFDAVGGVVFRPLAPERHVEIYLCRVSPP